MDIRGVRAMVKGIRNFVEAFLSTHPDPEPPPQLPAAIFENATYSQRAVDCTHFAVGGKYVDFPTLRSNEVVSFDRIRDSWVKRRSFRGYSPEGIEKRLQGLIVDCLNSPDDIEALVATLIGALEQQPVVDVLLPITGVDLRVAEWELVPGVRLVKMTNERFDSDVVEGYIRGAKASLPISSTAEASGRGMAEALRGAFIGKTVLRIRAEGDEYIAQAQAEALASVVVDALQFAAAVFHSQQWRTFIDWTGDVPTAGWRTSAQVPISGDVRPNNPGSRRGILAPWVIDHSQIARIVDLQVEAVIKAALRQDAPAEHEDMIRRAVRAFADGERQWSPDGKKLSYTTVFDIFFSNPNTDITRAIREGVAFIMWRRESIDQRFKLAQFLNKVYESRSRTSHDFVTGSFEQHDLQFLRELAYQFVGVMARRAAFTKMSLAIELENEREEMGEAYTRFEKLGRPGAEPVTEGN